MTRSDNKDEKILWALVRGLFLLIAALFIIIGVFGPKSDPTWLSSHLTGTFFDWLGSIMFISSLVIMSGVINGVKGLMAEPNTRRINIIAFLCVIAGPVLFWNL